MIDYYAVLGVSADADDQQITTAYRRLALTHHPDKARREDAEAAAQKFAQINEAYRLLLDKNGRAAFDRLLAVSKAAVERQRNMSEKRRALKEDLLYREDQFRREQEQREAERVLKRELARVQAEEEARRRREQAGRGESEEQCTLRYSILDNSQRMKDLQTIFTEAIKITRNQSRDGGFIVFDSVAAAKKAITMNIDGIILEWLIEPIKSTTIKGKAPNVDYERMTEEELERFTMKRLQQLSQQQPRSTA